MSRPRPFQPGATPMFVGVFMLSFRVLSEMTSGGIPPVTLALVAAQSILYLSPPNWATSDVSLSADKVLGRGRLEPILTAPFFHASDIHLFYNMVPTYAY